MAPRTRCSRSPSQRDEGATPHDSAPSFQGSGHFQVVPSVQQETSGIRPALHRSFPSALIPMTARPLPECFADYRDFHRGADVIVCGCGTSLALLEHPERFLTIGVNDVGRFFTPDYLVVVNERRQFQGERYRYVESTQAKVVFTQLEKLELPQTRVVRFRLGRRGGNELSDADTLHYSNNSPYVAVNLARYIGAKRIGIIGVDFSDDHFFGATGRHPLTSQLPQIEREYAALAEACRADRVELVNLSPTSRLESLPRASLSDWAGEQQGSTSPRPRVFFVHYRFLSCGTVFETGLREAARELGIEHEHAYWDDAQLPQRLERFKPDLLFVVHGRRFVQRWGRRLGKWRSAVWLLDEPYEVDDTSAWSGQFHAVFVNDPSTLTRHHRAYELPVAYTPALHYCTVDAARPRRTGFIGGANATRKATLAGLARRGLLDYVVGGPWHEAQLDQLSLASNLPAERTAELYRETAIVLNVFRDRHHYNHAGVPGVAMNPRIVEALACGALVLSEPRPCLKSAVPELPTFRSEAEAAALIEHYVADRSERLRVQRICAARLADATYLTRLRTAIDLAFDPMPTNKPASPPPSEQTEGSTTPSTTPPLPQTRFDALTPSDRVEPFDQNWDKLGGVMRRREGEEWLIDPGLRRGPGFERGLISRASYDAVELSFDACLEAGACLLAKVFQADRIDQETNSYHLFAEERNTYLARHHHVFRSLEPPRSAWVRWRLVCCNGVLSLWRNDQLIHRVRDDELKSGFAFLGAQGGAVRVRGLRLQPAHDPRSHLSDEGEVEELQVATVTPPRLSIVTTVYDRVDCLTQCIASVQRLTYQAFEHLIVADHPPPEVLDRIQSTVKLINDPRIGLYNLNRRHNNWGIAPAAAGLRRARGEFVAFLSDDNGYLPDHVEPLICALDQDTSFGFVYSSCQYDGRLELAHSVPRPGRIDLGQPMFRRELFELHFADDLPFDMIAWDWHLVDSLMRRGVNWRHVDRKSFIFRLAKYPQLMHASR